MILEAWGQKVLRARILSTRMLLSWLLDYRSWVFPYNSHWSGHARRPVTEALIAPPFLVLVNPWTKLGSSEDGVGRQGTQHSEQVRLDPLSSSFNLIQISDETAKSFVLIIMLLTSQAFTSDLLFTRLSSFNILITSTVWMEMVT